MSGHSKWATIKRKKGAADAARSRVFTKLIRELTTAAKLGGADPGGNPRLRLAIDKAKENSMPKDNIERAIKKGAGADDGQSFEEISYEGYGPQGIAVIVQCLTDNKTRTVAEVRAAFSHNGGNMGESGSVSWIFEKKGQILVAAEGTTEDAVMEKALDAGAEDIENQGDAFSITTAFEDFFAVRSGIEAAGFKIRSAEITMIPKNTVKINDESTAGKVLKMIEAIEDNDDVQNVYANFDIDEIILEKLS